ncbi:DUF2829 domain-containing protein [Agrobacterium sp. LMR679]|uniref:DUF2829 domain-containing protein n=1 Tax=Agrobacterium sp. LMR679 TaxID=3014335 RepID=UPI0022B07ACA|nr:DUF2829 domain-containing protein [Agrobacterium sp. LMR679]MCZ4073557.1 DUF2829 domain-containing protein [Agrobacterium sp. LMR679]MCZ4076251.1 DUF2829 domain-containing protein [Agrobacterium sp. LMR679]
MTQDYYGTKRVQAWPQEKDGQSGYAVKYSDGYISWSPKDVFESAYKPVTCMNFGHAVEALKSGHRVARAGWNGKNMFLVLVPGSTGLTVDEGRPLAKAGVPVGTVFDYLPHIDMFTTTGSFVPWLASQTDMLAEDWMIVSAA